MTSIDQIIDASIIMAQEDSLPGFLRFLSGDEMLQTDSANGVG